MNANMGKIHPLNVTLHSAIFTPTPLTIPKHYSTTNNTTMRWLSPAEMDGCRIRGCVLI